MVATSARLLKVLALLQARRFWTGGELAAELAVTERSVRRDVDRLRALGYPVHSEGGTGGGYALGAGKELPPLPLDDDEAVAVSVGLRAAASGPVKGLEAASLRALAKLEQVLPKRLRRRVNALEAVSVRFGDAGPAVDAEVLIALANACQDAVLVGFTYADRDGVETRREVEPYRLVHTAFRWYLLAFDGARRDWRTFRVDRIGAKPRLGARFQPRPLPATDVAAYVAKAVGARAERVAARVTIHASEREIREKSRWMPGIATPLDEARTRVELTGDSIDTLGYWLAYLGFDFEVHDAALAAHLRTLAHRLARAGTQRAARV